MARSRNQTKPDHPKVYYPGNPPRPGLGLVMMMMMMVESIMMTWLMVMMMMGKGKAISVAQVLVLKTFVISVAGNLIQTLKSFGKIHLAKIFGKIHILKRLGFWITDIAILLDKRRRRRKGSRPILVGKLGNFDQIKKVGMGC